MKKKKYGHYIDKWNSKRTTPAKWIPEFFFSFFPEVVVIRKTTRQLIKDGYNITNKDKTT